MTKRVYGAKYDKTLKVKEIAEKIRREVRLEANLGLLPKGKWSVTSDINSISVSFAPLVEEDELFARAYWNRDRVIDDVEDPRGGMHVRTLASEFGLALHERIEQKLRDYNHDGSDLMTDYFDVNFYTTVSIRPRTDRCTMMDLYRAGEWAEKTLTELNPVWAAMWEVWKKEAAPSVAEPPAPVVGIMAQADIKVGDQGTLEGDPRTWEVLRVFPRTPEKTPGLTVLQGGLSPSEDKRPRTYRDIHKIARDLARANNAPVMGMTAAEVAKAAGTTVVEIEGGIQKFEHPELRKLLDANTKARRASIAVPVEEPVPQTPNEAWLKLAQAYDLKLDWAIPGLK